MYGSRGVGWWAWSSQRGGEGRWALREKPCVGAVGVGGAARRADAGWRRAARRLASCWAQASFVLGAG